MATKKKKADELEDIPDEPIDMPEESQDETPTPPEDDPFSGSAKLPSTHYKVEFNVEFAKTKLEEAINFLKKSVKTGKNNTLPILADFHILFDYVDKSVTMTSTNLETKARFVIKDINVPMDFALCISIDELSRVIGACINPSIIMSIEKENMKIIDGFDEFVLDLLDEPAAFPLGSTNYENLIGLNFPKADLLAAIKECLSYTSGDKNGLRPALEGVCINSGVNGTDVVSTNAHILKYIHFEDIKSDDEISIIIPHDFCSALVNLSSLSEHGTKEFIELNVDKDSKDAFVTLFEGKYHISGRLIDAKFPNYKAVMPTTGFNTISFDLKTILRDVNRLTAINTETMYVVLNFAEDQVILKTKSSMSSKGSTIKMDVDIPKEFNVERIGFGIPLLLTLLKGLSSEKIFIHVIAENRPCLVTPDETPKDNISLIMPVMIG